MKALALVLLVLALGAGLFFFVQGTDHGRGTRAEHEKTSRPVDTRAPAPAHEARSEEPSNTADTSREAGSRRQSMEATGAPEVRLVIEGAFEFSDGTGIHRDTNGAFAFSEDGRLVRVR